MKARTLDYTVLNPIEIAVKETNYMAPIREAIETYENRDIDVNVREFMEDVIQMLKDASLERARMMHIMESLYRCASNIQQQQQQTQQTQQHPKRSPCGGSGSGSGKYTFGDGW